MKNALRSIERLQGNTHSFNKALRHLLQTYIKCLDHTGSKGKRILSLGSKRLRLIEQDHFYVCPGHLKDRGFCTPVVNEAEVAARKKTEELEKEIEIVKKEYEDKMRKKKKDKEVKKKAKSKEDAKDKDNSNSKKDDDDEDEKDDVAEREKNNKVRS
ncbi:MAG: hypothetical protein Q9220_004044 [cf. Caloplaca sp. 1 TL-2023]